MEYFPSIQADRDTQKVNIIPGEYYSYRSTIFNWTAVEKSVNRIKAYSK